MRLLLDLILIIILIVSLWYGLKRGVIRSIIGLAMIIIALIFSNLVASTISKQLVPAMEPFVRGYLDSEEVTENVLAKLGYEDSDKSLTDILAEDSSLKYDYAYETIRQAGFFKDVSEDLADDAVNYAEKNNLSVTNAVITVVCNSSAYVLCVCVLFIILIVLFEAMVELLNININLPDREGIDSISGGIVGLIEGILICVLLCWALGFLGILIGKNVSDKGLMRFFLAFRFITRTLI